MEEIIESAAAGGSKGLSISVGVSASGWRGSWTPPAPAGGPWRRREPPGRSPRLRNLGGWAEYGRGGFVARKLRGRLQRRLTSRPDPLYPLKVKIAMDLGLLEKARRVGWGNLSSAETGRVGGWMTRLYGRTPPRFLRLWPGRERRQRGVR